MHRLTLALCLLATPLFAADLFPFVLPWDDATPSVTDLSPLLEKPAGAQGFVAARDGHLYAGPKRIRFFGVNVAFGGNFPSHADAEKVAARLAKFGINCVRFHHMDTGTAPAGLLQKDRVTLDPEALDRLDYFIAQLKGHGIYANLNLHVGNEYPGMPKWPGASGYFKGVDNFYPPMIEQQHAYARALLTHVNPYTHAAYTAEPAVAFIEINNENGLMMEWNGGALDALPDPYAPEFRRLWNAWLQTKYLDQPHLATAWQEGEQPLGDELLRYPTHWDFELHEGAQATKTLAPSGTLTVNVATIGREPWHVQLSQSGLQVEAGRTYTVQLRARAATARTIAVSLGQTHAPWNVLASLQVKLTPEWQDLTLALTPKESEPGARLAITNLAAATGEVSFEKASLRPGGILGLGEGETLGTVDFFRKSAIRRRTLAAQRDWSHFLVDTESAYWPGMSHFIKGELGARSLVLGSATGFSPWLAQAQLDVVDAHAYWQHPHFPHRQWDMNDWTVKNEPMTDSPDGGTLPGLALRRVAGKPFIVTEYNHAAPNTYSSEAFLELCAVAALQDWDGMFAFAYCHRLDQWDTGHITSFFDIDQHPTKMATLPAALSLFYRADLVPPPVPHIVTPTPEQALESLRQNGSWADARAYGIQREETFQHPIAMRLPGQEVPIPSASPALTNTDALTWDTAARRMLLQTPRLVGVVGHLTPGETIKLGPVTIIPGATRQSWATITVTVLEGDTIATARRLLITATGDTENTAMGWKTPEKTTVGSDWGKSPSLVEGIPATINLPALPQLHAWPLDERGHRRAEIPLQTTPTSTQLQISPDQKTLWWELARPE